MNYQHRNMETIYLVATNTKIGPMYFEYRIYTEYGRPYSSFTSGATTCFTAELTRTASSKKKTKSRTCAHEHCGDTLPWLAQAGRTFLSCGGNLIKSLHNHGSPKLHGDRHDGDQVKNVPIFRHMQLHSDELDSPRG